MAQSLAVRHLDQQGVALGSGVLRDARSVRLWAESQQTCRGEPMGSEQLPARSDSGRVFRPVVQGYAKDPHASGA